MGSNTEKYSPDTILTKEDRQQIRARGISEATVLAQLEIFREGIPPLKLKKPCTPPERHYRHR